MQVAFLLLSSSLWLQAQRGGGSAQNAGRSFSSPARTFAAPSRSFFSGPATRSPSFPVHPPRPWPGGTTGYRNNGGVGYRHFAYTGYPWLFPFGYGFSDGDEQSEVGVYQPPPQQTEQAPGDYEQMAENAPAPFRPEYQGPSVVPARDQPATTLIFKDGRPSAEVQNYALTATTLYALDGDLRKEIPLSLLDVPATVEANRAAGVDFALPSSH